MLSRYVLSHVLKNETFYLELHHVMHIFSGLFLNLTANATLNLPYLVIPLDKATLYGSLWTDPSAADSWCSQLTMDNKFSAHGRFSQEMAEAD